MRILASLPFLGLLLAAPLGAHPNHEHKAMGTIQSLEEGVLHVDTTEGKRLSFALMKDTEILRGDASVTAKDLVAGERVVVVFVEEKEEKQARRVLVGSGEKR
jgi:hypothetical protein